MGIARIARTALVCILVVAVGLLLVSGGSDSGPRTPAALPGLPPPFLGTAVSGDGGLTAAVDAYGDVVDLRPGPAGAALIDNPSERQAAGTVPEGTGIVPRLAGRPMWEADSVSQRYLPGTSVVRTVARFGARRVVMTTAATGRSLALAIKAPEGMTPSLTIDVASSLRCARERRARHLDLVCLPGRAAPAAAAGVLIAAAARDARHWLDRSRPLGSASAAAPRWAHRLYTRSLLTIRALTSRATGAVAAGARDGWAYVWPRDAATAALALEASGHRAEARRVARFLTGLDLAAAARFTETGDPVPGRAAQGDARGWVAAATRATDVPAPPGPFAWRHRADYQESTPGTYLGNALAATTPDVDGPKTQPWLEFSAHQHGAVEESARITREFATAGGLVREAGDPSSGLDSAAAWAVRPFRLHPLYPAAERTVLRLTAQGTRYGITPGEGWTGGNDPWTAPTAWSAWTLAALARARESGVRDPRTNLPAVREGGGPSLRSPQSQGAHGAGAPSVRSPQSPAVRARAAPARRSPREAALALLADLRRAATPAGDLPERVGVRTGIPTSTTPLLWSSAFTVLALRELWP